MLYNQRCSTYDIHILYSMMKLREKKYRLKDLGYMPIYLSMEYMRISVFHKLPWPSGSFCYVGHTHYYDKNKKQVYDECLHIDENTVSGINVKFVEPINMFKQAIEREEMRNISYFFDFAIYFDFFECLKYGYEYLKNYGKTDDFYGLFRSVNGRLRHEYVRKSNFIREVGDRIKNAKKIVRQIYDDCFVIKLKKEDYHLL